MSEHVFEYDPYAGLGEFAYEMREPIVRCRDCTSFVVDGNQVAKCTTPCGDSLHGTASCDPDGFCAWGERREK